MVSVVRLSGVIGTGGSLRAALDLATVAPALEKAFSIGGVKAVAVIVNSPGGSPVQSSLIYTRLRALAAEKELPVFSFAEDVAASGGYMLLLSGDEIYANESSVIGSIGVISAGFGFDQLIEKIGIERRVHATGVAKGALDPFRPEKKTDVARLKDLHKDVYKSFTDLVRERRAGKLKDDEKELFSGAFWTGVKANKLGLVDGLGDVRSVMREKYGDKTKFKLIPLERSFLRRLRHGGASGSAAGAAAIGAAIGDELISSLETRALWARFGL